MNGKKISKAVITFVLTIITSILTMGAFSLYGQWTLVNAMPFFFFYFFAETVVTTSFVPIFLALIFIAAVFLYKNKQASLTYSLVLIPSFIGYCIVSVLINRNDFLRMLNNNDGGFEYMTNFTLPVAVGSIISAMLIFLFATILDLYFKDSDTLTFFPLIAPASVIVGVIVGFGFCVAGGFTSDLCVIGPTYVALGIAIINVILLVVRSVLISKDYYEFQYD